MDETYGTYVDDLIRALKFVSYRKMFLTFMTMMMIPTMMLMMMLMMILMTIRESVSNQGSRIKDLVWARMSILVYWYTVT